MATTTSTAGARKALLDYSVYVPLGAAKLAADKAKDLSDRAWKLAHDRRDRFGKFYGELADRGKKLSTSIRNSSYTKRAVEQVKTARSQVKSAATSVRKATNATAEATREAAKKVS
jgi:hypothetical protein